LELLVKKPDALILAVLGDTVAEVDDCFVSLDVQLELGKKAEGACA